MSLEGKRSLGLVTDIVTSLEVTKEQEKQEISMTQENVCLGKNAFIYLPNPSCSASLSENQVCFLDYKDKRKVSS